MPNLYVPTFSFGTRTGTWLGSDSAPLKPSAIHPHGLRRLLTGGLPRKLAAGGEGRKIPASGSSISYQEVGCQIFLLAETTNYLASFAVYGKCDINMYHPRWYAPYYDFYRLGRPDCIMAVASSKTMLLIAIDHWARGLDPQEGHPSN